MDYYAYGSNLATRYIREYCPSARFLRRADLPNFRVEFRHYSEDMRGGISSIVEAPGEWVRGCLYDIPEIELAALDELESVPEGKYRRDGFLVLGEDGEWQLAQLYRVARPSGPYPPSRRYLDLMIEGAKEHELLPSYVERLVALQKSLG